MVPPPRSTLRNALARAQQLAKLLIDDEDVHEGPFFCPLPENNCEPSAFLLAWKLDTNGTTFIASPYRLPWLDADCSDWVDDEDRDDGVAYSRHRCWGSVPAQR